MKILKNYDLVKDTLKKYPKTRDNDVSLAFRVYEKLGYPPLNTSLFQILTLMANKQVPHWESISRCRRRVQKDCHELRGENYAKRQNEQVEVKGELGYNVPISYGQAKLF